MIKNFTFLIIMLIIICSCVSKNQTESLEGENAMSIQITSSAFTEGGMIPEKYTCKGEDVSPPLKWSQVPPDAKSIALISDDPDAPGGTWIHWVLYNLPVNITELSEAIPPKEILSNGARHGKNSWGRIGYGGPCPPSGTHRYYFKIYALDIVLNLSVGSTKAQLLKAIEGHILSEGQVMGKFKK